MKTIKSARVKVIKGNLRNPSVLRGWGSGAHKKLKGRASYTRKVKHSKSNEIS